ncbi:hypothetical protein HDU87_001083 [Geranomyces variabilis]|uniref:Carrier domain-containing protein n=1 Tax=Geranomyces variabilis TaxID=109894 RepID=A0AAD5XU20_9FUNG|nr:hypothetical protein HDU87_001083 [Geranomyces variabilis]
MTSFIADLEKVVAENQDHVFLKYPKGGEFHSLNGRSLAAAVTAGTTHYRNSLRLSNTNDGPTVLGFLSSSHANYLLSVLSLMSISVVPLLLSPRNAVLGIKDLLEKSHAMGVVAEPGKFDAVLAELKKEMPDLVVYDSFDFNPVLDKGPGDQAKVEFALDPRLRQGPELPEEKCMAMHSSGSTSFPKLRYWTSRALQHNISFNFGSAMTDDISNGSGSTEMYKSLFLPAPLFHMMGILNMFKTISSVGCTVLPLLSAPHRPRDLVEAVGKGEARSMILPPSLLESMVHYLDAEPDRWNQLDYLKLIVYGGAPCPDAIVIKVRARGKEVRSGYGSTEIGVLLRTISGEEWNVMTPSVADKWIRWEPMGNERFRLLVNTKFPGFASGVTDDEWYDTNDIWLQVRDRCYVHRGRADDIILHLNGEKTNPVPMEQALRSHPIVHEAIVVGTGRFQCSAFIQLDREEVLKYNPMEMMEKVYEAVDDANRAAPQHSRLVRELVEVLPLGFEEFPTTEGKGNVKRIPAEKMLESRINALYERYEKGYSVISDAASVPGDIVEYARGVLAEAMKVDRAVIDPNSTVSLFELGLDSLTATQVRNKLAKVVGPDVPEDVLFTNSSMKELGDYLKTLRPAASAAGSTDVQQVIRKELASIVGVPDAQLAADVSMFELGLDSLGATTLRNRLAKTLHKDFKVELIFDESTITSLAAALDGASHAAAPAAEDGLHPQSRPVQKEGKGASKARDLLAKYVDQLATVTPLAKSNRTTSGPRTVLLTGSTGALGVAVLSTLLNNSSVDKVYCLHRGGDDLNRESQAYEQRGMDAEVLKTAAKQGKVVGLNSKFEDEWLGVGQDKYNELAAHVTDVIHVAWPVNWSFPVDAFDGSIKGVFNFLKFSTTTTRKSFHFISSVSAYMRPKQGKSIPERPVPDDPSVASPMGYGLSKWVSERLIEEAAHRLDINATILRCGQLAGDSRTGAWNKTDFHLALVATGLNLGVLPQGSENIDWIPMDVAADGLVDLSFRSNAAAAAAAVAGGGEQPPQFNVYHIANPHTATWPAIADTFARLGRKKIEFVPRAEFLKRIQTPDARKRNPVLSDQLLAIFQRMLADKKGADDAVGEDETSSPGAQLETQKASAACEKIAKCVSVADEHYWKVLIEEMERGGAVLALNGEKA